MPYMDGNLWISSFEIFWNRSNPSSEEGVIMESMARGQSAGNRTDFAEVVYRVRECVSSPKSFPSMPND